MKLQGKISRELELDWFTKDVRSRGTISMQPADLT
eukprot:CAMPEP_0179211098 /NCGR_PEP_ID=MMETSP0797-20121207/213_1 /TAXON_ID=47934 /ORGANISM="Dinophysis acuminata, Strain DAEP01" /LENGTH=34 /DNA_ID= /DNA_START= /DNA_END= /DNA_ORIENTATION=